MIKITNKEMLKAVKPKNVKRDDKYSKNLYKFLKNHNANCKVYFNKKNWDKKDITINWDDVQTTQVIIGGNIQEDIWEGKNTGMVIGKGLSSILNGNKLKEEGAYCLFGRFYPNRDFIDITDEFWKRYIRIGRCLFTSHDSYWDNEDRFIYVGNTRKCKWCGKWQHKEIVKKVEIKRETVWK